ncbi:hypothetical protein ScPMuIL_009566 [Solemya velum]
MCLAFVWGEMKTVDMSHDLSIATPFWVGMPRFNFTILNRNNTSRGFWLENNAFQIAEHGGTHLDAPAHYYKGSWRTQLIPMDSLFGPGVVINVTDKVLTNPDYRVKTSDLSQWEANYGRIPPNAVIIMNSGWQYKFPNKTRVFNTTDPEDPSTYHFPGWHEEAVQWLVDNRQVNIIGVDTPSTDYGQATHFPVHVLLGKYQIPGLENVANLDNVPKHGAIIYAPVVKLHDGSGGPARVFATYDDDAAVVCFASRVSLGVSYVLVLFVFLFPYVLVIRFKQRERAR